METVPATAKYREARRAWESGEMQAARSLYLEAIAADDTFALPHYDLGSMLERSDPSAARGHYARFVELGAGDEKLASLVGKAAQRLAAMPPAAERPPPPPAPAKRTPRTKTTEQLRTSSKISDHPVAQMLWGLMILFGAAVATLNWLAVNSSERDAVTPIFGVLGLVVGGLLVANAVLKWAVRRRSRR